MLSVKRRTWAGLSGNFPGAPNKAGGQEEHAIPQRHPLFPFPIPPSKLVLAALSFMSEIFLVRWQGPVKRGPPQLRGRPVFCYRKGFLSHLLLSPHCSSCLAAALEYEPVGRCDPNHGRLLEAKKEGVPGVRGRTDTLAPPFPVPQPGTVVFTV